MSAWVPSRIPFAYTVLFTCLAAALSEMTSNTASASMIVPIAIAVGGAAGVSPLQPALGATLGASVCFMLPISTPPNAIAYSSGHVPVGTMVTYGVSLSIVSSAVIIAMVSIMASVVF